MDSIAKKIENLVYLSRLHPNAYCHKGMLCKIYRKVIQRVVLENWFNYYQR